MVNIPGTFQSSGWLFPVIAFLFTGVYSGLACLILARALAHTPGNGRFQKQWEFSNLANALFPLWLYRTVIILLIMTFQVSNMSAIVESAQTMDSTLRAVFSKTCAMVVHSPDGQTLNAFTTTGCSNRHPDTIALWQQSADHGFQNMYDICTRTLSRNSSSDDDIQCCGDDGFYIGCVSQCTLQSPANWDSFKPKTFICVGQEYDASITDSPFGDDYVISLGYLVVLTVTIPIGFFDLESNMWVQVLGFVLLIYCFFAWMIQFLVIGLDPTDRLPILNPGGSGSVLANVVFNFGFVVTVPSWLNEKRREVSVHHTVWMTILVGGSMFLGLGLIGGASNVDFSNQDLLAAVTSGKNSGWYAILAAYLFPPAALLTGIPVFSIIIRYNLVENKICRPLVANLFAVVFPWVVSLFFYTGSFLTQLINWSSAFIFTALNFTFPLLVYVVAKDRKIDESNQIETDKLLPLVNDKEIDDEGIEPVVVLPKGFEWVCCNLHGDRLVWFLVGISVVLSILTLSLQIADPQ
jgi:hypothetical protein